MERRRFPGHGCGLALLAAAAVGLLLCLVMITQPLVAECRETTRFVEEAGDPDMPDRVESGPFRSSGLAVTLPGNARLFEVETRESWAGTPASREPWRDYIQTRRLVMWLLRAWSSVASWRFAF